MAAFESLSATAARHAALAAQGFADRRPQGRVDARQARRALAQAGIVQIDSVNVVARSHDLPLFSRLGSYPPGLLARLAYSDKEFFEYWGHEASYLPVSLHPHIRWKMGRAHELAWGSLRRVQAERPDLVKKVLAEIADAGPLPAGGLSGGERGQGAWWAWSDTKIALEWLFWTGEVSAASRGRNFERLYDLTERVIPATVLDLPTPSEDDARRELAFFAATRLGVATAGDIADYWRFRLAPTRLRLAELVEDGALIPVSVEGWKEHAYLDPAAITPRRRPRAEGALLSPFDSLVWTRPRTERIFGMRLRLEIFTPAAKRVHGYYVLPFLLGGRLVARVDLKADRKPGRLLVLGAYAEEHSTAGEVAGPLAAELGLMAGWLGLAQGVVVGERGDLAPALRAALPSS